MALPLVDQPMASFEIDRSRYDTANAHDPEYEAPPGVTEDVVRTISESKGEPDWMLQKRLQGLKLWQQTPFPSWGPDLSKLIGDIDKIKFYVRPKAKESRNWEDLPEDIRRTYEKIGIPEAEKKSLSGVGAQYDCLTGESLIYTNPKGAVKLHDIREGDTVFAWNEEKNCIEKAKVTAFLDKGERQVFEITVAGRKIRVTENHPFLALVDRRKPGRQRARYKKEWRYLRDLREGDFIAVATDLPDCGSSYTFPVVHMKEKVVGRNQTGKTYSLPIAHCYNKIMLPKKSTEDVMWFLGLYLGDGYIHHAKGKEKKRVGIAIPESQEELREELAKVCQNIFDYAITSKEKHRMVLNSTILAKFIERIGFGGKAKTKKIPDWVFALPKEEKQAFLGGYLDSDGAVRKATDKSKTKNPFFTSANKNLLVQAKELCTYCGIQTSRITSFASGRTTKTGEKIVGYRLHLSGKIQRLKSRFPMKRDRLFGQKRFHGGKFTSARGTTIRAHCSDSVGFARITSIVPAGRDSVYDISVEGHRNFVAEGIIVHNSDVVYHNLKKEWEDQGVVFTNMDVAVRKYPDLVKKYFMTSCVPVNDHKFVMLHAAVWSGGTFIYVPKGVRIRIPLQAYFRMNAEYGGQFEHTLIIADEDSEVHYVEGCFTEGNIVTTNPDYKRIEKIREGEKVLTSEGAFKCTKQLQRSLYSGKLYTIEVYGDTTQKIEVTEEHPFLYVDREKKNEKNKRWTPRWNIPSFFKKGDYLAVPINSEVVVRKTYPFTIIRGKSRGTKGSKFREWQWDVPAKKEFFRLLGYYLAEGSVSGGYYLNFSFNENERAYIEDVKHCLCSVFGPTKSIEMHHTKNHGTSVVVCSADLARLFSHFGTACDRKCLPSMLMYAPQKLQRELILGWFRGDGNYYNRKHSSGTKEAFRISTTSEKLARQGRDILLRLGIVSFLNKRNRSKEHRKDIFTVGISGDQMENFGKLVDMPVKAKLNGKRRAGKFGRTEKFAFVPIKSISWREVKNHPVYNFEVEDHHTYTVGGVAVHNCSAPQYNSSALHAGCVELHVLKGARVRYSSVENWSRNTYNLNTKRAIVQEDAVVEWVNGNLGCLTGETNVFTQRGPVPIRDIQPEDRVFSWDRKKRAICHADVHAVMQTGEKKVYRIQAAGRELQASANHPFLTLSRQKRCPEHKKNFFQYEWKSLSYLKKGDVIGIPKNIPFQGAPYALPEVSVETQVRSHNQYATFMMSTKHLYANLTIPTHTNDEFMWIAGVILGDGHIDSENNKINIAVHESELHRDEVCRVLQNLFDYTVTERKERYIIVNSKLLCRLFNSIGFGGTADSKDIPRWVHTLPDSQALAFLSGYLDSDGHVSANSVAFTSVSKSLLENAKLLALRLGFGVSRVFSHGTERKTEIRGAACHAKASWRLLCNGSAVQKLSPKSAKRKKLGSLKTNRNFSTKSGWNFKSKTNEHFGFARIDTIEEMRTEMTYDIEVSEHHNFIAEGIIVHNSGVTMLYPCSVLVGERARSDSLGIAFAGKGQNQDTGSKVVHAAPHTSSTITSKSISKDGGICTYRGLVKVMPSAKKSKVSVECDALLIGEESTNNTYPMMKIGNNKVEIAHEATVGKIGTDEIFYLMSRGLSEEQAKQMIVSGFIEPIVKELPLEYSVELNKLIELEMEGSIG